MGTSSSYGGHKDSNPLLPPDYEGNEPSSDNDVPGNEGSGPADNNDMPSNDEPAPNSDTPSTDGNVQSDDTNKPDNVSPSVTTTDPRSSNPQHYTPWQNVKTSFSHYISGRTPGGSAGVQRVLRNYGQATGRTAGLMRTSRSGINVGNSFAQFITNNYPEQNSIFTSINSIMESETDIKTALSKIADILSPIPEFKEQAVARDAIINTLCSLYDYLEKNNLDITSLRNLDNALQEQLLTKYISEYIWGRMMNDLQTCFEKHADNTSRASEVEKEFKEYIYAKVSVEVHKGMEGLETGENFNIDKLFRDCYEGVM